MVISLVLSCLFVPANYAGVSQKRAIVAILPCSDVVATFKKFNPLMQYLKQQTGLDIELVVPKDSEGFEWAVKNQEIDFVFQDPHTYVSLSRLFNRNSLIKTLTRDGGAYQYGLFIARKDSGITKIGDLKGKTVMFGPKLSATKWIAAKEAFRKIGLNIDKDLKAYQNGGCCEDIAFNVYLKAVDAGVVCEHFIGEHSEKQKELGIDVKDITIIGRTGPVPTRVFVARKGLDDNIVSRINNALLRLDKNNPAHATILFPAEIGGFQRAKDKDYDGVRALLGMKRSMEQ